MDLKNVKFMSLGGCCLDIAYLGSFRIKGPVDNIRYEKGLICCSRLINNTIYEYLNSESYIKEPRKKGYPEDSPYEFKWEDYSIVHNDWENKNYRLNFLKRLDTFHQYLEKSRANSDYLFTYSISKADILNHKNLSPSFYEGLDFLKSVGLLQKTIFVGNKKNENSYGYKFNHFCKELSNINNIKYVQLNGAGCWKKEIGESQFYEYLQSL